MLAIVGIAATARHADAGLASSHHAAALARHLAAAASATDAAMATSKLASSASPPVIQPTWRSTVSITSAGPSASVLGATYIFAENGVKKRRALRSTTKIPFAPLSFVGTPLEWINMTNWTPPPGQTPGIDLNGVLLNSTGAGTYTAGLFAWLPAATAQGTEMLGNRTLDKWGLTAGATSLYLLVSPEAPTVPVLWHIATTTFTGNYTFSSFDGSPPPDDDLWVAYNSSQLLNPAPCAEPVDKTPKSVDMYIFHPEDNFDIGGQDLGNAAGDTAFTCIDVLLGAPGSMDHSYSWITAWTIELVPRWGQYQNCNGYGDEHVCLGANTALVGHEAAEGLGAPAGGQCTNNPEVGEWWSLPMAAECLGAGQAPGDDCSWKKAARLKTINSKCLFEQHGFADLCKSERRSPFAKASAAFLAAFASEDVTKGGCPALVPHPLRDQTVDTLVKLD